MGRGFIPACNNKIINPFIVDNLPDILHEHNHQRLIATHPA